MLIQVPVIERNGAEFVRDYGFNTEKIVRVTDDGSSVIITYEEDNTPDPVEYLVDPGTSITDIRDMAPESLFQVTVTAKNNFYSNLNFPKPYTGIANQLFAIERVNTLEEINGGAATRIHYREIPGSTLVTMWDVSEVISDILSSVTSGSVTGSLVANPVDTTITDKVPFTVGNTTVYLLASNNGI